MKREMKAAVLIGALGFTFSGWSVSAEVPGVSAPLDERFALVMPTPKEELWRSVGWHTNLMEARLVAQKENRPVFLWIMVGNPHGCT